MTGAKPFRKVALGPAGVAVERDAHDQVLLKSAAPLGAYPARLTEPPSIDLGEVTDKGSINQHAVLQARAALIGQLYAEPPPRHVIQAMPGASS